MFVELDAPIGDRPQFHGEPVEWQHGIAGHVVLALRGALQRDRPDLSIIAVDAHDVGDL